MTRRRSCLGAGLALALTAAASATVIVPEGNGCPEAALQAEAKVESAAETLRIRGHYHGAGPASGVLLEFRVDSDRYRAEMPGFLQLVAGDDGQPREAGGHFQRSAASAASSVS